MRRWRAAIVFVRRRRGLRRRLGQDGGRWLGVNRGGVYRYFVAASASDQRDRNANYGHDRQGDQ